MRMRLLPLFFAAAAASWNCTVTPSGWLTLSHFPTGAAINRACPSLSPHPDAEPVSACDPTQYLPPTIHTTSGGTFVDHIVSFSPHLGTLNTAFDLVVRVFGDPRSHLHRLHHNTDPIATTLAIAHIQLRFARSANLSSNYLAPLTGGSWVLGAGRMSTASILDVPIDNDVESMYAVFKASDVAMPAQGKSAYVAAFYGW